MSHNNEYKSVFVLFFFRLGILIWKNSSKSRLFSLFAYEYGFKGNSTANYIHNTIERHIKDTNLIFNGCL